MSRAERPKGTAAHFIKGMRRPSGLRLLSLREATSGSVTASKTWPMAFTKPTTVRTPRITVPWVMRVGRPDSLEG